MIDRRTFVQQSAAALAVTGGTFGLATAHDRLIPVHSAIFDRRFRVARRFARTIGAQGVATLSITGDVTSIWFERLHPLWKRQPVAIAGLTTYAPLFCLERLAWDHGMRVLRRDQHDSPSADTPLSDSRVGGEPDQLLYSWVIAPRRST